MRQTAVITLISVAVLAAVSLATPVEEVSLATSVEEVSLATPVEEVLLATSVEEVSDQIDDENFAETLLDMLEIDIPDDMVVSSIDISINLVPKDSSKEVENVENVIPATGGRSPGYPVGRTLCRSQCADRKQDCEAWSNRGFCNKYSRWMNINCKKSCNKCDQGGLSKGSFSSGCNFTWSKVYNG